MIQSNAKVKIIGTNNVGESLEDLYSVIEQENLQEIVTIDENGRFGEAKKKELLDADYFIQTSRSEGLPLGVLEALSYGIPLVTTNPVGFSDIIDEFKCGFHCDTDLYDISEMIKNAIKNRNEIGRMSVNAFEAVKKFEWSYVTRKTLDLYSNILKEK